MLRARPNEPPPKEPVMSRIPVPATIDSAPEASQPLLRAVEKQLGALEKRLANPGFVQKAKPEVVESERQKLTQWTARRAQLAALVQSLGGA